MNKLVSTIVLTAVVLSPLSLISSITAAAAHHTRSHVSTVSTNLLKVRQIKMNPAKKQVRLRKGINRSI
jgi:hypothetical protein